MHGSRLEMSNQRNDKGQARRYILRYLVEHPDAGDTLDGIVGWWLLNQKIRFETRIVSRAVAELVAQHLILEQKCADGHVIYRANRTGENTQAMPGATRALSDEEPV